MTATADFHFPKKRDEANIKRAGKKVFFDIGSTMHVPGSKQENGQQQQQEEKKESKQKRNKRKKCFPHLYLAAILSFSLLLTSAGGAEDISTLTGNLLKSGQSSFGSLPGFGPSPRQILEMRQLNLRLRRRRQRRFLAGDLDELLLERRQKREPKPAAFSPTEDEESGRTGGKCPRNRRFFF